MKTDWIKMTDRAPTEADLPVWGHTTAGHVCLYDTDEVACFKMAVKTGHIIHWRPAKDDVPEPPREVTQRDKDVAAWEEWRNSQGGFPFVDDTWHAACDYARKDEREQVKKMLPNRKQWQTSDALGKADDAIRAIEAIRARCGGGGK